MQPFRSLLLLALWRMLLIDASCCKRGFQSSRAIISAYQCWSVFCFSLVFWLLFSMIIYYNNFFFYRSLYIIIACELRPTYDPTSATWCWLQKHISLLSSLPFLPSFFHISKFPVHNVVTFYVRWVHNVVMFYVRWFSVVMFYVRWFWRMFYIYYSIIVIQLC